MQAALDSTAMARDIIRKLLQFNRFSFHHEPFEGLKRGEFIFLASLAFISAPEPDGIKASVLGKHMLITSSAVTHNLNALEKVGYIERVSDPADRRIVRVRLTESGQRVLEAGNAVFLDSLRGLIEFLGAEDSRELHRLLLKSMDYFKSTEGSMK